MAITSQEQNTLIKLVIGMFGIAPGYTYLPVVTEGFEDLGKQLPDAATALAALPQFKALYPAGMSATAFATTFLGPMGLASDPTAQRLAVDMFNAGVPPEQIILQAVLALDGSNAPAYASARALLNHKTELASYHALILGRTDTDFTVLRKVLENVTDDPASVDAAKAALNLPLPPGPATDPAPQPPATTIATKQFSADTGASNSDWTTKTAAQTISGTLGSALLADETVQVSLDDGLTWHDAQPTVGRTGFEYAATLSGSDVLKLRVSGSGGFGPVTSQAYVLDTTPPAAPTAELVQDTGVSASDRITTNPAVQVSGLEAGATWRYSVDGGLNWQAGSGSAFTLAPGTYAVNKVLVDQDDLAGNRSSSGALAAASIQGIFTTGADTFSTTDATAVFNATLGTGATLTANDSLHGNSNGATLNITDTSGTVPDQWPSGLDLSGITNISLTTAGNAGSSAIALDPRFSGTQNFTLHSSGTGTDYLRGGSVNLTVETQASAIAVVSGFGSLDITANNLAGPTALQLAGTGGAITLHSPTGANALAIATNAVTLTGGFTDADNHITSLTIAGTTNLSKIDAVNASALANLTVTGKVVLGTSNTSRFIVGANVTTLDLSAATALASDGTSYLTLDGTGTTGDYKLGSLTVQLDMKNTHANAVITVGKEASYTGTVPHHVLVNVPATVQIDMAGEADLTQATAAISISSLLATAAANPGKAFWKTIGINTYLVESATGILGSGDTTFIGIVGAHTPTYDAVSHNILVG